MAKKIKRPTTLPQAGVFKGGPLNGWRFHFRWFALNGLELRIVALCTPPAWPFHRELEVEARHFLQMRRIVGERAKQILVVPLIETLYRSIGFTPPAWMLDHNTTLRARMKRSQTLRRA